MPGFSLSPPEPAASEYRQGDVACRVLTYKGQHCGNKYGTTRCRDYCDRLRQKWQDTLVPLALQILQSDQVYIKDASSQQWFDASAHYSSAAFWQGYTKTRVVVCLEAFAGGHHIYSGQVTLVPGGDDDAQVVQITVPQMNGQAIEALKERVPPGSVVDVDDNVMFIRAPFKGLMRVRELVQLGVVLAVAESVERLDQPFSVDAYYVLPDLTVYDANARDSNHYEVVITKGEGLRLGGIN